ncbi:hypothetical protein GCM10020254_00800 [Streptomyces goshikiensis]
MTGLDLGNLTDPASQVLLVVAVLMGVCLLLTVVRYVLADKGTRVSMRQAVRVRWGWVRLARMAGADGHRQDAGPAGTDHLVQGRPRPRAQGADASDQGQARSVRRDRAC